MCSSKDASVGSFSVSSSAASRWPCLWVRASVESEHTRRSPAGWARRVRPISLRLLAQLTPSSGVVVYRLWNWVTSPAPQGNSNAPQPVGYEVVPVNIVGLVAVQVNADGTLTIEPVPGAQDPSRFAGFSGAKRTYRR